MRGFILAAGLGTRLRPWTDHTPKPLVDVGGEPLIERAVRQLVAAGVTEIGVNLFHLGGQISAKLGGGSHLGARLTWFDEHPRVLGTGGGLKNAEAWLRHSDAFLLVNADVWHDFDLGAVRRSQASGRLATMVVHRTARRPELHTVACALDRADARRDRGPIVQIAGKPAAGRHADFMAIYTGVALFSTRLLDYLPPAGEVSSLVTHALIPGLERGDAVDWVEPAGRWYDCGTHAEVLRASAVALRCRAGITSS